MKFFLFIVTIYILMPGCGLLYDRCKNRVPQKWHIGDVEAELVARKPVLKVGDTIYFKFRLEKNLMDVDSLPINIDQGVTVFNKITTTRNYSDTTSGDFFGTDTTIFKVFNKYFFERANKGRMINAYTFECDFDVNAWVVEVTYILRKPGNFKAEFQVWDILSSDSGLDDETCMQGDYHTFGARAVWKESKNNRIDVLFNDEKEMYPNFFGFIVEQ